MDFIKNVVFSRGLELIFRFLLFGLLVLIGRLLSSDWFFLSGLLLLFREVKFEGKLLLLFFLFVIFLLLDMLIVSLWLIINICYN